VVFPRPWHDPRRWTGFRLLTKAVLYDAAIDWLLGGVASCWLADWFVPEANPADVTDAHRAELLRPLLGASFALAVLGLLVGSFRSGAIGVLLWWRGTHGGSR
jgi:hypothetical protein